MYNLRRKIKHLFQYELGLPIFVRVGTVGKLSLNIPWNRLCNQTAVVTIEVGQQSVFFSHQFVGI